LFDGPHLLVGLLISEMLADAESLSTLMQWVNGMMYKVQLA
jgi:hypothetical protein